MNEQYSKLVDAAVKVRLNSYSPYSEFRVGAALLGKSGRVYVGTNVENASFGLSICAERSAIFQAVAAGEREFEAIAICADGSDRTPPCGACRQVLVEFGLDMVVLLAGHDGNEGEICSYTVAELMPLAFRTFKTNNNNTNSVDTDN